MKNLGLLGLVAFVLVLVGGVNWFFIGLFRVDLVGLILGNFSLLSRLVYILVGLSAGYLIYMWVQKKL